MLRPAQAFRFGRRIEKGEGPVLPGEAFEARFVNWRKRAGRGGQHAAIAFDHDGADFGKARADKGDARRAIVSRHVADPFRARAGLAEAAPGAD